MAIEYEKRDKIGIITINNPPMNVLSVSVINEFHAVLDGIEKDAKLRVLIITGKGKSFVAGADIKEMAEMDYCAALTFSIEGQRVCDRIQSLEIPVIAAVNGFAFGGGTELAIACDIRIASEAAEFGLPEVGLGVIPGFGGTQRLARLIGPGKAKELILTGDRICAKTALDIGLVQKVASAHEVSLGFFIDNGETLRIAIKMAEKIASRGPLAVQFSKDLIDIGFGLHQNQEMQFEANAFASLFDTNDQKEGMKAFIEKRPPKFQGK